MKESNKKTASNLMESNVGQSSGSSFMYKEKNLALTHCQMHQIEKMARDISSSSNGAVLHSSSPTDKMIQYMKNTPSISFIYSIFFDVSSFSNKHGSLHKCKPMKHSPYIPHLASISSRV